MFIPNSFAVLSQETCVIKCCWLRSREAALLETQLNFVRTCPCQAKDKIRLLIQKLEGSVCGRR